MANDASRLWLDRRHPEYERYVSHWEFLRDSYIGGPDFPQRHLFRFWRESEGSYAKRLERAHRYNFSAAVVNVIIGYLWQQPPSREIDVLPEPLQAFWRNADRAGHPIDTVMAQQVSPWVAVYGRPWLVVDRPPEGATTRAEARARRLHPYLAVVAPMDVLDGRMVDGELEWLLLRERTRDDVNPMTSTGEITERFRLWTRQVWQLWRVELDEKQLRKPVLEADGEHGLGIVPVAPVDHRAPISPWVSPSLTWEIAYLDRSIFNHISLLDDILYNVTFPQLRIPWQSILPGQTEPDRPGVSTEDRVRQMAMEEAFVYDAQSPTAPEWMAPDPAPAQTLRERIKEEIDELYRRMGLGGEMAEHVSEASGISREHEFRKLNKMLATMADNLEAAEVRVLKIAARWEDIDPETIPQNVVDYPETFDVKTLLDEIEEIKAMADAGLPDLVLNEARKDVVRRRFSKMPAEQMDALLEAIDQVVGIPSVDTDAEEERQRRVRMGQDENE